MKRQIVPTTVSLLMLCALILGACQPAPLPAAPISAAAAAPTTQQAKEAAMDVIDQFFEAYRTYDMDKMLSLHTNDAIWTWIDVGKNLPVLGPEGKRVGTGRDGIRVMFELDRGQYGFSGYIVWSEVAGDTITATELWDSDYAHQIDVPLITQSTYKLRDGKIAEWVWTVSPESARRFMTTVNTIEVNKQLITAINEEIWNQGKLDLIAKHYASNYVRHQPGYPAEPPGIEGLKQFIQVVRTGFPDWNCTIEDMLAAGDKVAVRYLCQGTHTGEWMGIPPTGKPIKFNSYIIHEIADGKVVEDWANPDMLGFMQQIGFELVPAQKAASGYQPPSVLVQGAQIRSPNGIKAGPDGNLYVASINERAILVINPETGEIVKRLGSEVGVDGPDDLAFGPDGSIYWTDFFKGSVGRLAPDGSMSSQKVAPGVNPIILSKDGRLFVALAFLGDALYELDPKLAAPPRLLAEKLGGLNSFQFGPDGMLYAPVMEKGQVVRIDVNAEPIKVEVVAGGLAGHTYAAKLDSQGRLYTMSPPGIVRINMTTGATETFATVPYGMDNFIFDAQDRLFVSLLGEGTIAEAKPDGTPRMLGPAGLVMPGGIAVVARPDGESVFVGNFWNLREFDGATGKLRRTVDSLGPGTVAIDGENMVLSNWFSNSVLVWNPQTQKILEEYYDFKTPLNAVRFQGDLVVAELGSGSVVRTSTANPKQRTTLAKGLGVPAGLAVSKDELWVSDRATGKVWQLAAGGKVLAEPKLAASGLDRPEGMALAPDGRLLVAETGTGRLVAIDPATGAVSIIAEGLGFNPAGPEGMIPTGIMSSVAVGPSGVLYVTGDLANVVYRIELAPPQAASGYQPSTVQALAPDARAYAHPEALASTDWLAAHLDDPSVRILDGRDAFTGGEPDYVAGHIPGAVYVDVWNGLSDPNGAVPGLILPKAQFEALIGRLGIGNDTTVVVYDDTGGAWMAKMWWALHYYGHDKVKVLNGGLKNWILEGRSLEKGVNTPTLASFKAQVRPELLAALDDVQQAILDPDVVLIDALTTQYHDGSESLNGLRRGHIPTAVNLPALDTLDPTNHTLLPPNELARLWQKVGLKPAQRAITYCGAGYYGALDLFALYQLGHEKFSLYDASWMEWGANPDLPVETTPGQG